MKRQKAAEKAAKAYSVSRKIDGWFSPEAAMLIGLIDFCQKKRDIFGDIFEIGVHHGKSSTFMAGLLRRNEKLAVCDIFGEQSYNDSSSGKGDEDIFRANMGKVLDPNRLEIFRKYSTKLTEEEIGKRYRIFHIDGGHNCDEALSDLHLGAKCIAEGGVLILDDPLRPEWPGVAEALVRFLDENKNFGAFILGFNKMCLAERKYISIYRNLYTDKKTRELFKIGYPHSLKQLPFCDEDLNILYVNSNINPHSFKSKLVRYIKSKPALADLIRS